MWDALQRIWGEASASTRMPVPPTTLDDAIQRQKNA
jgi:hypothetical protein